MDFYKIKLLNETDVPFLWDILYEICCDRCLRKGQEKPTRDIIKIPELAKYVQDCGRKGDQGFIAISTNNQSSIAAAWYRLFQEDDKGYGFIDNATPEIGIAVLPEYRNKGLGKALILYLLEQAKADGYQQISLSCDPTNNHALHLYRKLGFEQVGLIGTSWVMKKVVI